MSWSVVCSGLFAGQARSHRYCTDVKAGTVPVGAGLPAKKATRCFSVDTHPPPGASIRLGARR
ncbi:hypothetical protein C1X72_09810 [Pseudomonas sp. FW306-2-2C-D06B]|nr:hypothetical protein C1X72_09810 [Pseudomonas sp. FW306-2-2C-D06B]PNB00333.1 hypothetical protein C1X74_05855 [Pseudomonas sp. GW460-5]PNB59810.1 hypothetical protein C1X73_09955 [Pseudomonas sp. FW305-130]